MDQPRLPPAMTYSEDLRHVDDLFYDDAGEIPKHVRPTFDALSDGGMPILAPRFLSQWTSGVEVLSARAQELRDFFGRYAWFHPGGDRPRFDTSNHTDGSASSVILYHAIRPATIILDKIEMILDQYQSDSPLVGILGRYSGFMHGAGVIPHTPSPWKLAKLEADWNAAVEHAVAATSFGRVEAVMADTAGAEDVSEESSAIKYQHTLTCHDGRIPFNLLTIKVQNRFEFLTIKVQNRSDFRPSVLRSVLVDETEVASPFHDREGGTYRLHTQAMISKLFRDPQSQPHQFVTSAARYVLKVVSQLWNVMAWSGHEYGIIASDTCALILKATGGLDAEFILCDFDEFHLNLPNGSAYQPGLAELIVIVGTLSLEAGRRTNDEIVRLAGQQLELADSFLQTEQPRADIPAQTSDDAQGDTQTSSVASVASVSTASSQPAHDGSPSEPSTRREADELPFPADMTELNKFAARFLGPAPNGYYFPHTRAWRIQRLKLAYQWRRFDGIEGFNSAISAITPRIAFQATTLDFVPEPPMRAE